MNSQFNPSQFISQVFGNERLMQNNTASNARNCYNNGDTAGLEKIARNLCQTRGVNYDDMKSQIMRTHGLR